MGSGALWRGRGESAEHLMGRGRLTEGSGETGWFGLWEGGRPAQEEVLRRSCGKLHRSYRSRPDLGQVGLKPLSRAIARKQHWPIGVFQHFPCPPAQKGGVQIEFAQS